MGSYTTGSYSIDTNGTNVILRSGAGTNYDVVSTIPDKTVLNISSINSNWGYTTYNGYSGWICLDFAAAYVPTITSISIKTEPFNTDYYVGETLDTVGLEIAATYNNGSTQTVNGEYTTDYDFSTPGTKTVTVTYAGKTATFTVTVEAPATDPDPDPNAPTLTVASVKGRPGKTVDVAFDLSNNPGLAGMQLLLSYAPELTLEAINVGTALPDLTFTPPGNLAANPVTLLWDGQDADSSNGTALTCTFRIAENAAEGDYALTVTHNANDVYDGNLQDVALAVVNGKVTVRNVMLGDLDGNESINAKDVTILRRVIAGGYDVTADAMAADVNNDGSVNAKDVTVLRRFIAGGYGITLE